MNREIDDLQQMTVPQLRQKYREVFGAEASTTHRQFLLRRLAWRIQANREGGLPEASRLLAQAIARDAPLRVRVCDDVEKRRAGIPLERTVTTRIAPDNDSRLPMPGSLIVRQFRGQTIVVKVLDNGFEYNDRRFKSLSAIAQEITGTKWNGFLFFGLAKEKPIARPS